MAALPKITIENEKDFLKTQYPILEHLAGIQYDPEKLSMEEGEAVSCLDIETGEVIERAIVDGIESSIPMGNPIYTIGGKTYMYHRVWPNYEFQKEIDSKKESLSTRNT